MDNPLTCIAAILVEEDSILNLYSVSTDSLQ